MPAKTAGPAIKDYYAILQVDSGACPEVINAARRALLKRVHPDLGNSGLRSSDVEEAFDVVSDAKKRADYDQARREGLNGNLVGSYRILDFIAEGGFGKTFKGEHIFTKLPVCIKDCSNVPTEYRKLLIDEARAMWDLRHHAIPVVRDVVERPSGDIALVMSYIPGHTLAKYIETYDHLDAEHVAWIAERVLNALKYIHFNGVIHGDLKPPNVIIQPESHLAVLVDFGLSLVKPTSSSVAKGYTEYFAPPESLDGGTLIPESDLYSLGMTMIYALAGLDGLQKKQVPKDTPRALRHFISRLIVRDVLERPQWDKEDLCDTIHAVRVEAFGRVRSSMKPLPAL
jgi:serine/threonine protein kinase